MTIRDYAAKHRKLATERGIDTAATSAVTEAYGKAVIRPYVRLQQRQARRKLTHQRHLLDAFREQDRWLLIIFDAGRYDYLAPLLSDTYAGYVRPTFSAARDTFEWISKVWQGDFGDVTYLSGMVPVADEIPDFDIEDFKRYYDGINPGDSIGEIVKLWETEWDDTLATVPPERITNAAMDYLDRDKLVVHYNQPHSPFIGTPKLLGHSNSRDAKPKRGRPNDEPCWHKVQSGEVSDEHLRMAYWGNAAEAIEAVEPLVQRRQGTIVATADHGEALGEFGMYTHDRAPHPKRRVVPWQRIDGVAKDVTKQSPFESVDEKLRALGYV